LFDVSTGWVFGARPWPTYITFFPAGKKWPLLNFIVDPRTGTALTEQRLVHVLAPDAITADSLATAISVLGPSEGLRLVTGDKRLGARVAFRGALGQVQVVESPVFRAWARPKK